LLGRLQHRVEPPVRRHWENGIPILPPDVQIKQNVVRDPQMKLVTQIRSPLAIVCRFPRVVTAPCYQRAKARQPSVIRALRCPRVWLACLLKSCPLSKMQVYNSEMAGTAAENMTTRDVTTSLP